MLFKEKVTVPYQPSTVQSSRNIITYFLHQLTTRLDWTHDWFVELIFEILGIPGPGAQVYLQDPSNAIIICFAVYSGVNWEVKFDDGFLSQTQAKCTGCGGRARRYSPCKFLKVFLNGGAISGCSLTLEQDLVSFLQRLKVPEFLLVLLLLPLIHGGRGADRDGRGDLGAMALGTRGVVHIPRGGEGKPY